MAGETDNTHAAEEPPVVVRDRRTIDQDNGEAATADPATEADTTAEAAGPGESPEPDTETAGEPDPGVAKQLEERTADLQRLQAEYANYRRRVERDREVAGVNAKAGLVGELLAVVDDVERAETHGDLTGAFKAVADKLGAVLTKTGLEPFGATGEPFDPQVHEAVQHDTSADVPGPTVTTVLRRGYRIGDRTLRSALVGVTDYEAPAAEASAETSGDAATETIDAEIVDTEPGFTEPEQQ